jgi:hypothetical protein
MSPSAIARTGFAGTRFTSIATPTSTFGTVTNGAACACAASRSRRAGERPSPGRSTFTSVTPISTDSAESATV